MVLDPLALVLLRQVKSKEPTTKATPQPAAATRMASWKPTVISHSLYGNEQFQNRKQAMSKIDGILTTYSQGQKAGCGG